MDKTQQTSGTANDFLNKEHAVMKKKPKTIAPPPVGQKLLSSEEIKKIQTVKKTTDQGPLSGAGAGAAAGAKAGAAADEPEAKERTAGEGGGLSSLLEGNNKYIVIAVALLAVYFLFIKKR